MPAVAVKFSDYQKHPKPKRVYCDSNFAISLLNWERLKTKQHLLPPADRACYSFCQLLLNDGVEIVASLFTYQEVLHFYCFQFQGGMYDVAANFLRSKGVTVPPSPHKQFK